MSRRWRPQRKAAEAAVCAEASAWLSQLMDEDRRVEITPEDLRARATRLHDQVRQLAGSDRA